MASNLTIYQKTYDFYLYIQAPLRQLPKHEKFVLGQQIRESLLAILRKIIITNKTRNKLPMLFEIDTELEVLRTLIRMTRDLKYMPIKQYGMCAFYADEIGKMLGGWIKASSEKK